VSVIPIRSGEMPENDTGLPEPTYISPFLLLRHSETRQEWRNPRSISL